MAALLTLLGAACCNVRATHLVQIALIPQQEHQLELTAVGAESWLQQHWQQLQQVDT
jgi:hypothetical protein